MTVLTIRWPDRDKELGSAPTFGRLDGFGLDGRDVGTAERAAGSLQPPS